MNRLRAADGATRRLSPLTWIIGALRETLALLAVAVTALLVSDGWVGFSFAAAALGFGLAHQIVRWWTFTYTVREDRIELRHQFIGRSVKTIPLDRVRGVDITASLPHRLLGLAVVRVDAASDGDEAVLDAVSRREAVRLRELLLGSRAEPSQEQVIARADPTWYRYAPLSGAYLLTPFALIGSLLGTLYNLISEFGLVSRGTLTHLGDQVVGLPPFAVIAVVLLLVAAMPVASVLVFTWFNWDFTLRAVPGEDEKGALVAERGLLTRRSVMLERRRIRGVELRDNPLERRKNVARLTALVTGLGDAEQRGRLLPTAPREAAFAVTEEVVGKFKESLARHPKAARTRRLTRAVLPPVAVCVLSVLTGPLWLAYTAAVLALGAVPLALDRYAQLGHASDGRLLSVRSGSLVRTQQIIEHRAVVGWRFRQSLFQRRRDLVTLTIAVGAGEGSYEALDLSEEDALRLAHTVNPAWITPFLADPAPALPDTADTPPDTAATGLLDTVPPPDTVAPPGVLGPPDAAGADTAGAPGGRALERPAE